MSKDEAIILAQYVINIVEEFVEKKLRISENSTNRNESMQVQSKTGLRIVKKFIRNKSGNNFSNIRKYKKTKTEAN